MVDALRKARERYQGLSVQLRSTEVSERIYDVVHKFGRCDSHSVPLSCTGNTPK
jgi:hypothetical protein